MHEFLVADRARAILMRGTEGEAYANPRRRPAMEAFREGAAEFAWEAEAGGAPPLDGLPEAPAVAENAALIRAMLAGEAAIPQPIADQVAALLRLAREA